jgi:chemotaxis-related protein WspB
MIAMLMLLFYVEDDSYAIDCESIIEVIPKVKLKQIPHVPNYVNGLLNFGGTPVAVIDLCQLIAGRPSSSSLHTRIILLSRTNPVGETHTMGIIAEKVTETIDRDKADFIDSGLKVKDFPYLGGVLHEQEQMIQLIHIDQLFESMRGILFKE